MARSVDRRFPIGAEPSPNEGTHFRIWAPQRRNVEIVTRTARSNAAGTAVALERESSGYFSGWVAELRSGDLYSVRLDADATLYPDPASRFQPDGPHGPSQIVDPAQYRWSDQGFEGTREKGQVLYELHVGTFTREGTYAAAAEQLAELRALGITTLELMPLADFPGRFGWGYDGVNLWAPTRLYGAPDELRRFIDRAHQHGLAVILDVVYNHLGPDGNHLKAFSNDYFTDRYANEWGEAINFDGPTAAPVREFFVQNARYWLEEYHFDGFRLDATQSIHDASERHILAELTQTVRATGERQHKRVYVVAENEPQEGKLVRPVEQGGYGCDALWNDDFHHSARAAITGCRQAYFLDYAGTPQEFISALRWGYLYQGQHYFWQKNRRGKPALDLDASKFVTYIQNHDQVANSLGGDRIDRLSSAAELRAMTALMLLAPPTPMLLQGQEFASSKPFLYFADHNPELAGLVQRGRKEFLAQFTTIAHPDSQERLADPADPQTFERCKLDFTERELHAEVYALHRDLLALRSSEPAFAQQRNDLMHGAVLSAQAFLLRFFCEAGDRLVLVNFGIELPLSPCPEPLLAPPEGYDWVVAWCSEHPKYGGKGIIAPASDGTFRLTARSVTVLAPGAPEPGTAAESG